MDDNLIVKQKSNNDLSNVESQIATFQIDKEFFGIGIHKIKEIVRYPSITHVPRAAAYLKGLANLRGNVLPVIDSRIRLNLPISETSDSTRVLVLDLDNSLIGVIVDKVRGVASLEDMTIEAVPPILSSGVESRYIQNVIKSKKKDEIIMELDVDKLCDIEVQRLSMTGSKQDTLVREAKEKKIINERQLVTFLVSNEEFGFPINTVQEVLRVDHITEVPDAPRYVLGVISIRNQLLPIIDIRRLFTLPSLIEDKVAEVKNLQDSYANWVKSIQGAIGSGLSAAIDIKNIKLTNWLEKFRTSSETIGAILQNLRFTVQDLVFKAAKLESYIRTENVEYQNNYFESQIKLDFNQFMVKFDELKDAIRLDIKEDQRILVADVAGMSVGIMVDRMHQVIRVSEDMIDQPPRIMSNQKAETLEGIVKLDQGKRLILLLDEKKLFDESIMKEFRHMGHNDHIHDQNNIDKVLDAAKEEEIQMVTFKLAQEEYGIFIEDVREINRLESITAIPQAPIFVEGVMNLRGNVIPAIDLRKRFELEIVKHNESTRVIIVDIEGKMTGLIVDSVSEVLRLPQNMIEAPPDVILGSGNTDFIRGIGNLDNQGRFIIVVDVDKILSTSEIAQLDRTRNSKEKNSDKIIKTGNTSDGLENIGLNQNQNQNQKKENISKHNNLKVETEISNEPGIRKKENNNEAINIKTEKGKDKENDKELKKEIEIKNEKEKNTNEISENNVVKVALELHEPKKENE